MIERNLHRGFRELQAYVTVPTLNDQIINLETPSLPHLGPPPPTCMLLLYYTCNVVHSEAGVNILLVVCINYVVVNYIIMVKNVLPIATPTSLCDKGE